MKKFILMLGLMMLGLATITFAYDICSTSVPCGRTVGFLGTASIGNDTLCYQQGCGACVDTVPNSKNVADWQCMDNDTSGESYKCDFYGNWTDSKGDTGNVIGFDPFDWPWNTHFADNCEAVGFNVCKDVLPDGFDKNNSAPVGAPRDNPIYGIYGRCVNEKIEPPVPEMSMIGILAIVTIGIIAAFLIIKKK